MTGDSLAFADGQVTTTCSRCGVHETRPIKDGRIPTWGYVIYEEDRVIPEVRAYCPVCALVFIRREFPEFQ